MKIFYFIIACYLAMSNCYGKCKREPISSEPHLIIQSFTVIPHNETYTLAWKTTGEEDSSFTFKLQYSVDGTFWELINVVVPAQLTASGYSYTYRPTLIQALYFRIQQEDGFQNSFFSDTVASRLVTTAAITDSFDKYVPPTEIAFIEIGGNTFIYSLNFDSRFWKRNGGPGWRLGGGYIKLGNYEAAAATLMLNELLGFGGHYVELGAGMTIASGNTSSITSQPGNFTRLYATGNLGYRYQSIKEKGYVLRVTATPFTNNFKYLKWWGGITFGQKF